MRKRTQNRRATRGFTLLELMIVISLMLILMSIAVPMYQRSIAHARESVLRNDLFAMRSVIDQYTLDKQRAPQSLDDLVTAGYLKQIPTDPCTGSNSTWQTVEEDTLMAVDQQQPGIVDVHSGCDKVSDSGEPFSSW